ncbi:MAG TPA: GAF domain-containing protein [Thermoflexia bacterium]|nr:GAF domain-containing protein [Thermoflexia bacterium]
MSDKDVALAAHRATLLGAAAKVARNITSILNPDRLLRETVDVICEEFGFYYAGVFLSDETKRWMKLHAGRGEAGRKMVAQGHKLRVNGHSMIGRAASEHRALIALDVGAEPVHFKNPLLPDTHSEMALPLLVGDEVIGALTVQSTEVAAFEDEDVMVLQGMADQLAIAIQNAKLHREYQHLLRQAERRTRLLKVASTVAKDITSILDLDKLLREMVDVICEAYGFYYAGVFLLDETGEWAILSAGRGQAGATMVAAGHKLKVGGFSMIGASLSQRQGRIALDVGEEPVHFKNPLLPRTRSEMALPLVVGDEAIGALTVQSREAAAFSEEDITSLQAMADQLAVAIHNAQLVEDLEAAHEQLLRTKTFEAIATATGEAIHWVGNKAAPIPASADRIREDLTRYLVAAHTLLSKQPAEVREHKYARLVAQAVAQLEEQGVELAPVQAWLERWDWRRLRRMVSVASILEDLEIITGSAAAILHIKEDLIGPARERRIQPFAVGALLRETVASMGLPAEIVEFELEEELPLLYADRMQIKRVFINLLKNSMEAMAASVPPRLSLRAYRANGTGMVAIDVIDSGTGIPPELLDKIWVAFFTTKGDRGGTGLGLPACAQIVDALGGKITVASVVGVGTTFTVTLPAVEKEPPTVSQTAGEMLKQQLEMPQDLF